MKNSIYKHVLIDYMFLKMIYVFQEEDEATSGKENSKKVAGEISYITQMNTPFEVGLFK